MSNLSNPAQKPGTLLLSTITPAFFGAFFGIVGTVVASTLGYFTKDRELDLEMVRLSISILSAPASVAESDQMQRRFAVHALRQFSGVTLSDADLEAWAMARGSLPRITTVAEVCGSSASSYAVSASFDDEESKVLAARDLYTLERLGCIPKAD